MSTPPYELTIEAALIVLSSGTVANTIGSTVLSEVVILKKGTGKLAKSLAICSFCLFNLKFEAAPMFNHKVESTGFRRYPYSDL